MTQIKKRLDDLEKKAGADDQIKVVVNWDDPDFPEKINEGDKVIYITWDQNDDIIKTT